jgi:hypothetical protein
MAAYTNGLVELKTYLTNRHTFLIHHAELLPAAPRIPAVFPPWPRPGPTDVPFLTAQVEAGGPEGIDSVWLWWRDKPHGRFLSAPMFDDGNHGDGLAGDGVFGAATTNYPAGHKVHYYVEARAANSVKAAAFAPARAEQQTYSYRVTLTAAANTPVVINELMASNTSTLADPQGEFDDWIELHNVTDQDFDLTGRFLTDDPDNPTKWAFPEGTQIPANGYLIVWADEDESADAAPLVGLHANFKLDASGEQVLLIDTDTSLNAVLDSVTFGRQETDWSYGRTAADADVFSLMSPTPGSANR